MGEAQGESTQILTVSARYAWVLAALLSVTVGLIVWRDIQSDSTLAFPVLYIAAVLIATFGQRPWLVWWVATLSTVATLAAYTTKTSLVEWWFLNVSLANRLVTVAIMLLTALACQALLRRRHDLTRASNALRASEERLEENNRLLRIANDVTKIGGWYFDVADEPVISASDEVARVFGWEPGQPVDPDQAFQAFAEQDAVEVYRAFGECITHGVPFTHEGRIHVDDGLRWVRLMGEPVVDRHGTVVRVQGSFQDITAIKEVERMEGRFTHLADSLSVIVWTADAEGEFTYYNKAMEAYAGIPRSAALGRGWERIVHPDDLAHAKEKWGQAVAIGRSLDAEFRMRSSSGEYRWFHLRATPECDLTGAVQQWWGHSIDIHEHVALKAKAQALAVDRDDILQSIGDAVFSLDREWRFTYLNRNAESILRRSARDLTGQVVWDTFPDLRDSPIGDAYERAMTQRTSERITEPYGPSGMWFDITVTPSPQGLTVYFRDVTEVKRLTEQAAQAQRRDPGDQLAPEQLQPLKPVPVRLDAFLAEVTPSLTRACGDSVRMTVHVAPDVPDVFVDPAQLRQALTHLVTNAAAAMSSGGTLTIDVDGTDIAEPAVHPHGEITPGRYVTVAVRDTGQGIEPDLVAQLFDPQTTAAPSGAQVGMGLPMVWSFATRSGGHLTLASEPGRGTTAQLYLPVGDH